MKVRCYNTEKKGSKLLSFAFNFTLEIIFNYRRIRKKIWALTSYDTNHFGSLVVPRNVGPPRIFA